ncbi:transposase [Streptomyces sp. NPDC093795]|uniref:transposase n=1 Tax=Streptomyces sp. NPDC093795 TaxID=3366051 RepID=UPI00381A47C6
MRAELSCRLVPDPLWEMTAPLLPRFSLRPQGGGTAPLSERAVFTAVVYVLASGCPWRLLPEGFGVSSATAHRRFTVWSNSGLWAALDRTALATLGPGCEAAWVAAIVDAANLRRCEAG